ncbi:MAG: peptidoglycan editing factor PgeF [Gammaproteobacteria bacterium]|nr:peptidoglycan editing factor PgeF [Gammaproteobacteria bacterium]
MHLLANDDHLTPNWPAPSTVHAFTTTRLQGVSLPPYHANNLGDHVNDNPDDVTQNRQALRKRFQLPNEPIWLEQTHSTHCVIVENTTERKADAAITRTPNQVLAILTADCLPILLCDREGREIAAIHAGWRGLADGVIESTLQQMQTPPHQLMAWLGPRICARCFEVGEEVMAIFLAKYPKASAAFFSHKPGKYMLDMGQISTLILQAHQISSIDDAEACTFEDKEHFFSYRRDGQTGRIATLIWISEA